ncbi:class II glutamine amidotransferase [Legionella maceachernii]|uniref:Glutamine amidotransferase n=1 Tax=Legionella maceachernii TaxID=466 RepID=A0A0W0VX00_9GAMM|nr:class II glutamine amidotransferase [Legionella maceachernii]KTD24554.1 glutamine amidotransferase [Legionella maceachernii]SJZ62428.1 Glutamine amidotransferases class-II [Legionella maceachernii]SUP00973.1 Predicted glutamine amidotransferase [Legionella maceachernii]
MCRVLIYLGQNESSIFDLLYGPDNGLVHQSYAPQLMKHIQNLAGLGFCAWSKSSHYPKEPYLYKTTCLPFFDKNLFRLSKKLTTHCMVAHVRGVEYKTVETVSEQNVHPFKFDDTCFALAHNGSLAHMERLKVALVKYIKPQLMSMIKGTTDSEWVYVLFLSQFKDYRENVPMEEAFQAIVNTFEILGKARKECGIEEASPVNLFITNGEYLFVTRFVFNFGCNTSNVQKAFLEYHSLWLTVGESYSIVNGIYKMHGTGIRRNILFASEPLSTDRTTWIELPEYSITQAWIQEEEVNFRTFDLVVN